MIELDLDRWEIYSERRDGKRTYVDVRCIKCGDDFKNIRKDGLNKKQCCCYRKPLGKPLEVGERFGRLVVLEKDTSYKSDKNVKWIVQCDCGCVKSLQGSQLRSGSTKSCGCFLEEKRGKKRETHGMSKTKEYNTWTGVVNRTSNATESTRKWYFDKGIGMSEEWRSSFEQFYADLGPCPEGYSLDRIDPSGDYCKENCRWASLELQAINKGLYSNNSSGKTGVSFSKKNSRWVAYIYVGPDRIHLGSFMTYENAVEARLKAEEKYWSHIKE